MEERLTKTLADCHGGVAALLAALGLFMIAVGPALAIFGGAPPDELLPTGALGIGGGMFFLLLSALVGVTWVASRYLEVLDMSGLLSELETARRTRRFNRLRSFASAKLVGWVLWLGAILAMVATGAAAYVLNRAGVSDLEVGPLLTAGSFTALALLTAAGARRHVEALIARIDELDHRTPRDAS